MASNSFGPTKNLAGKEFRDGTLGEAISDLRADIETAFASVEGGGGSPILYSSSGTVTADPGSGAATSTIVLSGDNFWLTDLGSGSGACEAASVTIANAAGTSSFSVTALRPGAGGNDITLTLTEAAADACSTSGTDIALVQDNDDLTTCTELVALINGDGDADNLVFAAVVSGGATAWAEADLQASQNLIGGAGDNLQVHIGAITGTGIDPNAGSISWTDSSLALSDVANLGAADPATGDEIGIFLVYGSSNIRIGQFPVA